MPMTEFQKVQLDRAVGAVVGSAVGDALGAPLEFTRPRRADGSDWIRDMVGGGAFGWKPGETTDDTSMMRCVLEMYLENEARYDQDTLVRKFLQWFESRPPDVGSWTSFALRTWQGSGLVGIGKELKREGTHCYKPRYRSHNPVKKAWEESNSTHASNGGVMRCIPTALVHTPSMQKMLLDAKAICEDTHPAPACVASCQAVVWMAAKLIRDLDKPRSGKMRGPKRGAYTIYEVWADVMRVVLDLGVPELYEGLREAPSLPWGAWTNSGSSVGTTVSAFACLLQATSFEQGLVALVNRGNDADTAGAVAGGMLGARFGYSTIPQRWLKALVGHDELRAMAIELWLKRRPRG